MHIFLRVLFALDEFFGGGFGVVRLCVRSVGRRVGGIFGFFFGSDGIFWFVLLLPCEHVAVGVMFRISC